MLKILVPVDGSSASQRAVRHVIALAKGREPLDVHLVNVQPTADALELRRFKIEEEIRRMQLEQSAAALAPAKRLLERAGVKHQTHSLIGDPAQEIARLAKRGRFQKIVMGTHGRSAVTSLLMGSVATKVLHHASVPVTLVK